QKTEPGANLPDDFLRDLLLELGELEIREEVVCRLDGEGANIHDRKARAGAWTDEPRSYCALRNQTRNPRHIGFRPKSDRQYLRLQPLSIAGVAKLRIHEGLEPVLGELALAFLVEPFEIGDHSLKRARARAPFASSPKMELNLRLAGPAKEDFFKIFRQRAERGIQALLVMRGDALEQALVIDDHAFPPSPPREDGPLLERFFVIRHDQRLVENHFLPQPMTHRASSGGRIKGKMFGRGCLEAL